MEYEGKKITREEIKEVVEEVFNKELEKPMRSRFIKLMSVGEYNRRMEAYEKQKKNKQ